MGRSGERLTWRPRLGPWALALGLALLVACGGREKGPGLPAPSSGGAALVEAAALPALPGPRVSEFQVAPAGFKIVRTSPETGPVGTSFTITADGLPPGKKGEFVWVTVNGGYDVGEGSDGRVQYNKRVFREERVSLGGVTIGEDGKVSAKFTAPEDYGEVHDTYIVVDAQAVAKGGFRLLRSFTMTPEQGPLGTMITIKVTGLGWKALDSTLSLRYDNHYTGFISATTTRGTALAVFRAAGPVGQHYISLDAASHALPFLNIPTGGEGTRHLLPFEAVFAVTEDRGPPETRTEWPSREVLAGSETLKRIPTLGEMKSIAGVSLRVSPGSGPTLSKANLSVSGLAPGEADLVWVTPFPGTVIQEKLDRVTVGRSGSVDASVTIPEGLGGWRSLRVLQNEKPVAEAPFFVEASLLGVTPVRVKEGQKFTVLFKSGGWTELDNGVAVTYDNSYIGYVCGFANNGDTPIELVATGGKGTHLIDIYPYIFDGGHGEGPWQLNLPQITALRDHPGLALGYRLPIFRLAIEVTD